MQLGVMLCVGSLCHMSGGFTESSLQKANTLGHFRDVARSGGYGAVNSKVCACLSGEGLTVFLMRSDLSFEEGWTCFTTA